MSFGTKKVATPKLVDALWDFIRAVSKPAIKRTERKLTKEWRKGRKKEK